MGEDTEGSEAAGAKFLAEVARLLKPRSGSVYVCVTLAQAHVLSRPLQSGLQPYTLQSCSVSHSALHRPPGRASILMDPLQV